jgi:5-methylcytosine-specific restriction endonuclease McrA
MVLLPRARMSKLLQVQVFEQDKWLCRWCLRPVIFPPALKFLEHLLRSEGVSRQLAYFQTNWRRDKAPLLDELGASVDHVEAHSKGGSGDIQNLATICSRCNARKGALTAEEFLRRYPLRRVRGKHGEPIHWDGLASLFVLLISNHPQHATLTERRGWLR